MCIFGGDPAPLPPLPDPIPSPPTKVDPAVLKARAAFAARAKNIQRANANISTSPGGLTQSASTAKKTLLGA
jgi:hypothetical protein